MPCNMNATDHFQNASYRPSPKAYKKGLINYKKSVSYLCNFCNAWNGLVSKMEKKNSICIKNAAACQLPATLFPCLVAEADLGHRCGAQMCTVTEHLDNAVPAREVAPLRLQCSAQPRDGAGAAPSPAREPAVPARPLGPPALGASSRFLLSEHLA